MLLPENYYFAEYDKSLKIHVTPKDTKNEINMSLCGLINTKINISIIEAPQEKYMCKKCLYVLWTQNKMWHEQLDKDNFTREL